MRSLVNIALAGLVAGIAVPVLAADPVRTMIGAVATPDAGGAVTVEILFLNPGSTTQRFDAPERIAASLSIGGDRSSLTLERAGTVASLTIPAAGFGRAEYRGVLPSHGAGQSTLSLADGASFALAMPASDRALASAGPAAPAPAPGPVVVTESLNSAGADTGNAFLGSLSAYQPIYAVYGPGTNTDAKIQISFKFQLFGEGGAIGAGRSWIDGLHFAYTQRLYWDLGAKSSPFRNTDYMPELIYIVPAPVRPTGIAFGGRGGLAHESNGRDGVDSRSANLAYIQPMATLPIGDYKLTAGPRIWTYFGDLSDNPDIKRYRGNTGLFLEIGQDDGLRVTTNSRLNFGSGKGAVDVMASYPLDRLIGKSLNLYVFGQAFTGYGENLLDYNRHQNRLRFGLGFVR